MNVIEIIKAYETFKSHGLDVSHILNKEAVSSPKSHDSENNPDFLEGQTGNQYQFLRQILGDGKITKQATKVGQENNIEETNQVAGIQ